MLLKKYLKEKLKNNYKVMRFLLLLRNVIPNKKKIIHGKNNSIDRREAFLTKVVIDILGDSNEVIIKSGANISNVKIFMRGSGHSLVIGEKCIIKSGEFWFEDENCTIKIGNNTTIEGAHIAVTEPGGLISIGEDCMLSSNIDIRNGDSHSIIDRSTNKRINYALNITIGNHVWIGAFVQILKGAKIGDNTIIGIRSLVTRDIPPSCIATGIPAKPVKENIRWSRDRIYEKAHK